MNNHTDNNQNPPISDLHATKDHKKRINQHECEIDFSHQVTMLRELDERSAEINLEIQNGLRFMAQYPKTVTIFGSARLVPENKHYQKAKELAASLAGKGYAIVTGGGPGIMQAGNQGSHEATGHAIGFGIELPHEQNLNEYVTHGINFEYFFTRKLAMNFSGKAYVCFPGGFGTMDEFFQILTLVQTGKVQKVPIILFGSEFWNPIREYSQKVMLEENQTISPEDMDLFVVTDSIEEAVSLIEAAPARTDYYN